MRRSLPLILASLLPLACAVHVQTGDAGATDPEKKSAESTPPDDAGAQPTPDTENSQPAQPVDEGGMPECPGDAGEESYCTDDGKLAGQWVPVDMLRVPEEAESIFEVTPPDADRQPSLSLAIEGDTLYIRHVSCGACARVMGQGFHGELSSMSEAQIRALQTRLGLAEDTVLLTSTERWRGFASADGKAVLTELAAVNDQAGIRGRSR